MSEPRQDFIAECQSCGRPFVMGQAGSTGMQIGTTGETYVEELVFHGDQIAMKGVQALCPHCGGMGQVPDGVYGLVANGYTVLSALTLPEVQRLASLLRRFTEDEAATDEDILAMVPDDARELVRSALTSNRRQYVAGILLAILLFIAGERSGHQATEDLRQEIRDAEARIEVAIDEQERDVTRIIAETLRRDHPRHGPSDHSPCDADIICFRAPPGSRPRPAPASSA